ncbi:MAG TPA: DoxX family protein [Aeromicrobium sp.]|nr:DoxX family protein [Aeromicrobium sp.]
MDEVFLLARILFVALMIMSGIGHLTQTAAMAGYAESRGVKNAPLMVQISGAAMVVGGISVLLGIWGDIGALGLAVLMVVTAVMMHGFWKDSDPMTKQTEMVSFNKDIALAGGALALFVILGMPGDTPYTITDALVDWY